MTGPDLPDASTPAIKIAGVRIDAVDRHVAADRILGAACAGQPLAVHLCNAYVLSLASTDPLYAAILADGDLNLADGAPVAWFARRAGLDSAERPSGVELVEEVLRRGLQTSTRHYFYGGDPKTITALTEEVRRRFPGIVVAGRESPPFAPVTDAQADDLGGALKETGAQIAWIGLGTPKQDDLVSRLRMRFDGPVVAVGAAFDFIGGTVRRAPAPLRRVGLEWVFRLAVEPRRLWKRYLVGNLRFLWVLARTGHVVRRSEGHAT